jgi:hypothetical protein
MAKLGLFLKSFRSVVVLLDVNEFFNRMDTLTIFKKTGNAEYPISNKENE